MSYAKKLGREDGGVSVPVVEALSAAMNLAETMARLGLKYSTLSYPESPE